MGYNVAMKGKTLSQVNPHLRDPEKAARQLIRSVASSTAIETGESVRDIEKKDQASGVPEAPRNACLTISFIGS